MKWLVLNETQTIRFAKQIKDFKLGSRVVFRLSIQAYATIGARAPEKVGGRHPIFFYTEKDIQMLLRDNNRYAQ